jgi:hypothetical protein
VTTSTEWSGRVIQRTFWWTMRIGKIGIFCKCLKIKELQTQGGPASITPWKSKTYNRWDRPPPPPIPIPYY